MTELEQTIEEKLIKQLTEGKSQWTYRPDLNDENKLWENIRQILERGNKEQLDGQPLTDKEFEQVKNQLSFPTFYDAAKWLAGENGVAHVSVQRDTKTIQLTVIKRDDIAGGSSVYEVINQYRALKDDDYDIHDQNRRFDVSLLVNVKITSLSRSAIQSFNLNILQSESSLYSCTAKSNLYYLHERCISWVFDNVSNFYIII